jgi:hypothetical protein
MALVASAAVAQARVDVVVASATALRFGEPFGLEVRRTAAAGSLFAPFDPARLRPLQLGPVERRVVPAAVAGDEVEVLRFAARCFAVGEVRIAPFADAVRLVDGRAIEVACPGIVLQVASILPEPPGDVEAPHDGRTEAVADARTWWLALAAAVVVGFGVARWGRRRRAASPTVAAVPAGPSLAQRTAAELAALSIADAEYFARLAACVRGFVGEHAGVSTTAKTSEELWRTHDVVDGSLRTCLWACDLAMFAAIEGDATKREASRAAALAYVTAKAAGGSGGVS